MKATEFEFRNRWWLFGVIYGAAFFLFAIDHVPVGVRVANFLTRRYGWPEMLTAQAVFGLGAAVLVLMAVWRTWGSAYLGREVVHDRAVHSESLHGDGPFRHTRNPLYFGNLIMALGMCLMAPVIGVPVILIGITVFCYRLIGREEQELDSGQGEAYRKYMAAVPRMFPSLSPCIASGGTQPDWVNGLAAEAFFWSFALGYVAFAVSLQTRWFFAGMALSPVVSWLATLAVRNREKANAAAK